MSYSDYIIDKTKFWSHELAKKLEVVIQFFMLSSTALVMSNILHKIVQYYRSTSKFTLILGQFS